MTEHDLHSDAGGAPARTTKTVMLVLDEPFVRELIASNLRAAGCFPLPVQTVGEGKRLAAQFIPDVIVIDLDNLAAEDSAWAMDLMHSGAAHPVRTAMLSSRMVQACGPDGSTCGATLCVEKPFEPRDLMGKLLRLLRPQREGATRPRPRAKPALRLTSIELEREQPTVRLRTPEGWVSVDLAWKEHRLLEFLLNDPNRVRSREVIRDAVWGDSPVDLRTVDQYVRRLRRSLEAADASAIVKTIKGIGYRLQLDVLNRAAN